MMASRSSALKVRIASWSSRFASLCSDSRSSASGFRYVVEIRISVANGPSGCRVQVRPVVWVVWGPEGGANFQVVHSAGKRGSEGIRVGDASCERAASMPFVVGLKTINATKSLSEAELGRILEVGSAAHVGFFGYPALVADVPVPGTSVDRRHDPPRLRRCAFCRFQPGSSGALLLDVAGGLL